RGHPLGRARPRAHRAELRGRGQRLHRQAGRLQGPGRDGRGPGRILAAAQPARAELPHMTEPLRILLVDDSESDAKLVAHALRRGFEDLTLERVDEAETLRAALAADEWDAVIVDWTMPRFTGLGALAVVHESGLDVVTVVISGTMGEDKAVDAM